jgi:hypothetical protein
MHWLGIGVIILACVFGGALGGMFIRGILPKHHLTKETEDSVRLAMGLIATMGALVIGLLLASAKTSFDTKDTEIKQLSVDLILLDRQLGHYGVEAKEARDLLRRYTVFKIDSTWPSETSHPVDHVNGWKLLEDVQDKLRGLAPQNDAQRWLQARGLQISSDLARTRWLLGEQTKASIPTPFVVLLVFWLTAIFAIIGVFAPRNATVTAVLFICSLSSTAAICLILEMDQPFGGLIHISSAPMRDALAHLGE